MEKELEAIIKNVARNCLEGVRRNWKELWKQLEGIGNILKELEVVGRT